MNNIDLIREKFPEVYSHNPDWCFGKLFNPKYKNKSTNLKSGMTALVKILKPKNVLEIGSFHYETSSCIADTMDIMFGKSSGGVVDSFEVRQGGYDGAGGLPTNERVKPHFWSPHHTSEHSNNTIGGRIAHPSAGLPNDEIFNSNSKYLQNIAPENLYDLILIDGDHSYEGISYDWKYVSLVSNPNTVIVIDNIVDQRPALYDVFRFFDNLKVPKYDFSDWNEKNKDKNMVQDMGVCLPDNF